MTEQTEVARMIAAVETQAEGTWEITVGKQSISPEEFQEIQALLLEIGRDQNKAVIASYDPFWKKTNVRWHTFPEDQAEREQTHEAAAL